MFGDSPQKISSISGHLEINLVLLSYFRDLLILHLLESGTDLRYIQKPLS